VTPELFFFILRLALALALYAFLGAIAYLLWRDLRAGTAAVAARQRPLGRLLVLEDRTIPEGAPPVSFPLLPVTSLGRAPTNTAALADETASLEHARLTLRGGQWWLEDLGSRNGTAVNGVQIEQPVVVSAGDEIGIGHVRLVLELD
jgi:FHA domain